MSRFSFDDASDSGTVSTGGELGPAPGFVLPLLSHLARSRGGSQRRNPTGNQNTPSKGRRSQRGRQNRLKRLLFLLVVLGSGLASGCHRPPPVEQGYTQTQLVGCWELELAGTDATRDSVREWLPRQSLPRIVELDTTSVSVPFREDDVRVAHSWFDDARKDRPFSVWHRSRSDSIVVRRAGALAGTELRMANRDGHLAGRVVLYTDAVRPDERRNQAAEIRARRASCPSPNE